MIMHRRIAFGVAQPFKVSVQGNGVDPALCLIIFIFLIRYLYHQKVFTAITSPIFKHCQLLAALLNEYDTDIYVFNSGFDNTQEKLAKAQHLNTCHEVLKFTGGVVKHARCTRLFKSIHGKKECANPTHQLPIRLALLKTI